MRFVYEKIDVSHNYSFITRRLQMDPHSDKIHMHKNFELNFICSGYGRRIVGNHVSTYEKGDVVLLAPNIPHCWEAAESGTKKYGIYIVTHFFENIISSGYFNTPELDNVVKLLKEADCGILFKGTGTEKVGESLKKMAKLEGLERYIEMLRVFALLLKVDNRECLSLPSMMPDAYNKDKERIEKIYEYVFQNIQHSIDLHTAADLICMETSSFCRYFKKNTGKTFMEYVINVRIGIAAKFLAETDKQIIQICYECGYNNLSNFNYYFKSIMKKTPSDYRKSFQS